MVHGRNLKENARRRAEYLRQREANVKAAAAAKERAAEVVRLQHEPGGRRELERVWGSEQEALRRLRDISKQLDKLHRAERVLLDERDRLVDVLRGRDVSWAMLSTWSGLSRQALSKRIS
ncbi:hypothetical protein [Microbacterium deminutum]|uniref:Uncharacterized protein n=1 Tax=Microbacterium deminutum TaxID=344164 RepID=A0ABN2RKV4_9MICO